MTFDLFILKLPYFLSISFLLQSDSLMLSFSIWFLAYLGTLSTGLLYGKQGLQQRRRRTLFNESPSMIGG
ncbi:hypothetical protein V6Z12_A08G162700 [Gossypium hirsutum]